MTRAFIAQTYIDTFERAYAAARQSDPRILDATSSFETGPISTTRYYLGHEGRCGFAIRGDELIYVFSLDRGNGDEIVSRAVAEGARRLDCFDGYLVTLYSRHGFRFVAREANWTPGGPDVVFMAIPTAHSCEASDPAWIDGECLTCGFIRPTA